MKRFKFLIRYLECKNNICQCIICRTGPITASNNLLVPYWLHGFQVISRYRFDIPEQQLAVTWLFMYGNLLSSNGFLFTNDEETCAASWWSSSSPWQMYSLMNDDINRTHELEKSVYIPLICWQKYILIFHWNMCDENEAELHCLNSRY